MRTNKKSKSIYLLLILIILITGCQGNPKPEEEKGDDNSPPELPKIVTELEEEILEAMFAIDGVAGIEKALAEKDKIKAEVEAESEVDLKQEEKEAPAKEEIDVEMMVMMESIIIPLLAEEDIESDIVLVDEVPNDVNKIWYQINKLSDNLHLKWNTLEPSLQKAGVSKDKIEKFEEDLAATTLLINSKETHDSLVGLNELTNDLYGFMGHFKTNTPSDVMQIKYHVRQIVLMAEADNYQEAISNYEKTKELGEGLRQRLTEKNAGDVSQKFELSMEDLRKELDKENFRLTQIKSVIILRNAVEMEEAFESSSH